MDSQMIVSYFDRVENDIEMTFRNGNTYLDGELIGTSFIEKRNILYLSINLGIKVFGEKFLNKNSHSNNEKTDRSFMISLSYNNKDMSNEIKSLVFHCKSIEEINGYANILEKGNKLTSLFCNQDTFEAIVDSLKFTITTNLSFVNMFSLNETFLNFLPIKFKYVVSDLIDLDEVVLTTYDKKTFKFLNSLTKEQLQDALATLGLTEGSIVREYFPLHPLKVLISKCVPVPQGYLYFKTTKLSIIFNDKINNYQLSNSKLSKVMMLNDNEKNINTGFKLIPLREKIESPFLNEINNIKNSKISEISDSNYFAYTDVKNLKTMNILSGSQVTIKVNSENITFKIFGINIIPNNFFYENFKDVYTSNAPLLFIHPIVFFNIGMPQGIYLIEKEISPSFQEALEVTVQKIKGFNFDKVYLAHCFSKLKQHFDTARVIRNGDLIPVVIDPQLAFEINSNAGPTSEFITNTSSNFDNTICWFKVSGIKTIEAKNARVAITLPDRTSLIQHKVVSMLLPQINIIPFHSFYMVEDYATLETLNNTGNQLFKIFKAAIKGLPTSILLSSSKHGTGKTVSVKAAAAHTGLQVEELDCGADLFHENSSIKYSNLRSFITKSCTSSPCVILLKNLDKIISTPTINFDTTGSNSSNTSKGNSSNDTNQESDDEKIVGNFLSSVWNIVANNAPRNFLIRRDAMQNNLDNNGEIQLDSFSNSSEISPNLFRIVEHPVVIIVATTNFLEKIPDNMKESFSFHINSSTPNEIEREVALNNIKKKFSGKKSFFSGKNIHNLSFAIDDGINLQKFQTASSGLTYLDIETAISNSVIKAYEQLFLLRKQKLSFVDPSYYWSMIECCGKISIDSELIFSSLLCQSENVSGLVPETIITSDIGGLDDAKKIIDDTLNVPLMNKSLFKNSMKKRSGLLFFGPPGTGKTLLAKGIAHSYGRSFISVKGPEVINKYIGESEANIRRLFERAKESSPCVVFFDELDSIAPRRGNQGDSGGVMDRIVSQLLAEIDGAPDNADNKDVFIIGATNRPDLLDPSLLRPGRFDKMIYLGVPDSAKEIESILNSLSRKFVVEDKQILTELSKSLQKKSYTGADLYALCADALTNAMVRVANNIKKVVTEYNDALSNAKNILENAKNSITKTFTEDVFSIDSLDRLGKESHKDLEFYKKRIDFTDDGANFLGEALRTVRRYLREDSKEKTPQKIDKFCLDNYFNTFKDDQNLCSNIIAFPLWISYGSDQDILPVEEMGNLSINETDDFNDQIPANSHRVEINNTIVEIVEPNDVDTRFNSNNNANNLSYPVLPAGNYVNIMNYTFNNNVQISEEERSQYIAFFNERSQYFTDNINDMQQTLYNLNNSPSSLEERLRYQEELNLLQNEFTSFVTFCSRYNELINPGEFQFYQPVQNHYSNVQNHYSNVQNHYSNVQNHYSNVQNHYPNVQNHYPNVQNHYSNVQNSNHTNFNSFNSEIENINNNNSSFHGFPGTLGPGNSFDATVDGGPSIYAIPRSDYSSNINTQQRDFAYNSYENYFPVVDSETAANEIRRRYIPPSTFSNIINNNLNGQSFPITVQTITVTATDVNYNSTNFEDLLSRELQTNPEAIRSRHPVIPDTVEQVLGSNCINTRVIVNREDFNNASTNLSSSVSPDELREYENLREEYAEGSSNQKEEVPETEKPSGSFNDNLEDDSDNEFY